MPVAGTVLHCKSAGRERKQHHEYRRCDDCQSVAGNDDDDDADDDDNDNDNNEDDDDDV